MPTLTECMNNIKKLCKDKGHGLSLEDVPNKLLFAIVEIGEAVDIWKKNGFTDESVDNIGEELIDGIFYILNAYGILREKFPDDVERIQSEYSLPNPDIMFKYKLKKNKNRPYRYGRSDSK